MAAPRRGRGQPLFLEGALDALGDGGGVLVGLELDEDFLVELVVEFERDAARTIVDIVERIAGFGRKGTGGDEAGPVGADQLEWFEPA